MAATISQVTVNPAATLAFYKCKVLFDAAATAVVNTGLSEIITYGFTNIDDTVERTSSVSGSQITVSGTDGSYCYVWAVGVV